MVRTASGSTIVLSVPRTFTIVSVGDQSVWCSLVGICEGDRVHFRPAAGEQNANFVPVKGGKELTSVPLRETES